MKYFTLTVSIILLLIITLFVITKQISHFSSWNFTFKSESGRIVSWTIAWLTGTEYDLISIINLHNLPIVVNMNFATDLKDWMLNLDYVVWSWNKTQKFKKAITLLDWLQGSHVVSLSSASWSIGDMILFHFNQQSSFFSHSFSFSGNLETKDDQSSLLPLSFRILPYDGQIKISCLPCFYRPISCTSCSLQPKISFYPWNLQPVVRKWNWNLFLFSS